MNKMIGIITACCVLCVSFGIYLPIYAEAENTIGTDDCASVSNILSIEELV